MDQRNAAGNGGDNIGEFKRIDAASPLEPPRSGDRRSPASVYKLMDLSDYSKLKQNSVMEYLSDCSNEGEDYLSDVGSDHEAVQENARDNPVYVLARRLRTRTVIGERVIRHEVSITVEHNRFALPSVPKNENQDVGAGVEGPQNARQRDDKSLFLEYLKLTEVAFVKNEGTVLSDLLSIRDDHIFPISEMNVSVCLQLIDEQCKMAVLAIIIKCHVLCIKALLERDLKTAFAKQVAFIINILSVLNSPGQAGQKWSLPLILVVAEELRIIAQKKATANNASTPDTECLEMAAEIILALFRICAEPNSNKKSGMLGISNELMQLFLDIKTYDRRLPTMTNAYNSTFGYLYNRPTQQCAFLLKFAFADDFLTFAFEHCPDDLQELKKLMLVRLEALRLAKGYTYSRAIHEKYGVVVFTDLKEAILARNIHKFSKLVDDFKEFFELHGVYDYIHRNVRSIAESRIYSELHPTQNKLQMAIYRNLALYRGEIYPSPNLDQEMSQPTENLNGRNGEGANRNGQPGQQ